MKKSNLAALLKISIEETLGPNNGTAAYDPKKNYRAKERDKYRKEAYKNQSYRRHQNPNKLGYG